MGRSRANLARVERPTDVAGLAELLRGQAYLADRGLSTSLYLALSMHRPVLLEGEAGVGKTEVARALAAGLDRELIRLQCYEGIDASQALYEWDYTRQLLYIRAATAGEGGGHVAVDDVFAPRFLVDRPLLKALRAGDRSVLLIDEIDRADDEFEAFLLEFLADFQVTIPEVGTVSVEVPPLVVLTSNRTRELHDALKRRCLYHWIDYPEPEREVEIVRVRAPDVPADLASQVAATVARLRELDLMKPPGIAESIDWARALAALDADELTLDAARDTLGALVKDHDDLERVTAALADVID
jgi:MoxR-like ATPase